MEKPNSTQQTTYLSPTHVLRIYDTSQRNPKTSLPLPLNKPPHPRINNHI